MKWRVALLTLLSAGVASSPARAHLVTTGLGPFYDGMSHLAVSLSDLLAVVALGLWAGLGGPAKSRAVLAVVPAGWLVGGLAGFMASREVLLPVMSALVLLVLGVLVAADVRLSRSTTAAIGAMVALLLGALNGTALAAGGGSRLGVVGIVTASSIVLFLLSALVASRRVPWQRIAVRVAGSWIAAVAILMIGWSFAASGAG